MDESSSTLNLNFFDFSAIEVVIGACDSFHKGRTDGNRLKISAAAVDKANCRVLYGEITFQKDSLNLWTADSVCVNNDEWAVLCGQAFTFIYSGQTDHIAASMRAYSGSDVVKYFKKLCFLKIADSAFDALKRRLVPYFYPDSYQIILKSNKYHRFIIPDFLTIQKYPINLILETNIFSFDPKIWYGVYDEIKDILPYFHDVMGLGQWLADLPARKPGIEVVMREPVVGSTGIEIVSDRQLVGWRFVPPFTEKFIYNPLLTKQGLYCFGADATRSRMVWYEISNIKNLSQLFPNCH